MYEYDPYSLLCVSSVKANIVQKGTWIYSESVEMPVDIVGLEYDWYYELDRTDGLLDEGEEPEPLGPEGLLYHVRFQKAGEEELGWVDGGCYQTIDDAIKAAESKITGIIHWQNG